VTLERVDLEDGYAQATVDAQRPGALILKASFDPRWQVTVDGKRFAPQMYSPSFVGRELPPGMHEVTFTYVPFPRYDVLFAIALITLLAPVIVARARRRRWRRRRRDGWDPEDD
jgi:uncharacterized membrane protein YfhO